ncbi:MAG TPA: hypothetical protein VKP03_02195 [Patescibacteria group bacterium]|nr:hypothetical protein [Patescibacteria group bacterium]
MNVGVPTEEHERHEEITRNILALQSKLKKAKTNGGDEEAIRKAEFDLKQARVGLRRFFKIHGELMATTT